MIQIRPATPADLPAIADIQTAAPQASHWPPADYLSYDCRVAESGSKIVAFLVTRQTAPGEREILNLAVHPHHRRQSIARLLLADALEAQAEWFLEVRASNQPAISLYRSLGFAIAGTRPEYYTAPPESGIVMKLRS